jgi:predicted metalloprotease with PDZ domain
MKHLAAATAVLLGLASLTATAQPLPATGTAPYPGVMTLQVDTTDLDHKIFKTVQTIPVRPGPLVLYRPRWLPGGHSPSAAVSRFSGLQISANGRRIEWRRNTLDVDAFHVEVPTGASTLEIESQYLTPLEGGGGRVTVTPEILGLQWDGVLLYPAGYPVAQIMVQPSVKLPEGWSQGGALEVAAQQANRISFKPVSVETLVDSPLFAGRHFRRVDLDPGAAQAGRAPVFLNIVADQPQHLAATPEQIDVHRALVTQADRLFGTRHFAHYDFLLGLSENFGGIGLEHHQSSENAVKANYFTEWAKTAPGRDLLAHEYVHSWNGKFRRPADLWTPHFNTPMQNSLLWVYEGQTQFWGAVLAARSGLLSPADAREDLAGAAASLDARAGRAWRNLQDTTNEPIISNRSWHHDWRSWQRSVDYYDEARLIWIEADMLIREASNGQRSMDDFARAFFGPQPSRPGTDMRPLTYEFDDVVRELNRVQPHDWRGFLRQRLDSNDVRAPLQGLTRSGWRLAWTDKPSEFRKAAETRNKSTDFIYSLGIEVSTKDNKLGAVAWGSPAFNAGITPAATLLAVNSRSYTPEGLKDAITAAKASGATIELLVKTGDLYRTFSVNYRGGLRYPTLERIDGTPDRLSELFAPRQER